MEGKIPESETLSREHLANERTLLSWMRTGINAVSVGILLGFAARFFSEGSTSANLLELGSRKEEFSLLGIGMVVFGAFLELVAVVRFVYYKHSIEQGTFTSSTLVYLFIVFSLILLGVAYIIYDVVA